MKLSYIFARYFGLQNKPSTGANWRAGVAVVSQVTHTPSTGFQSPF